MFGFQSTPPVKAATCNLCFIAEVQAISIHAAREGGDMATAIAEQYGEQISIHAAREGGDEYLLS